MSLRRLIQQNHNANFAGFCVSPYTPYLETMCSPQMDNKQFQNLANAVGTLPRGRRQFALRRSSSLDSSGPQRQLLAIIKEDNETFGFEIQTCRLPSQNDYSPETRTYVCRIQEKSPAHLSGLQTGDILANINGVNIEGFNHKQIVDLIKSSGNYLRIETVNGAMIFRRMELDNKLQSLKQTLREKLVEFRSLQLQEQRLLHGEVNDNTSFDAMETEEFNLFGSCTAPRPTFPIKSRFSSESSSKSRLSSMTVDSEDGFYQTCISEDSANETLSRQSSLDDDCFFQRDNDAVVGRSSLRRNRSISVASNGSMSPQWEGGSFPNIFGTLPRKSRKGSIRKQIFKFIPGLHRAVEEEESRV
ncbi:PREDICTED: cytohesin-interacting protein [Gavialis gangeticus]|uniref:cytohesin-interacting protein n=1 Tax=Gavialis gangeticus TaxID=94835 RepID=UPI00092FA839|nr:PREDICTED: cytohesin-interacting protein [Gavialis gangeticus]